jgi:hypothetical protein
VVACLCFTQSLWFYSVLVPCNASRDPKSMRARWVARRMAFTHTNTLRWLLRCSRLSRQKGRTDGRSG